MQGVLTLIRGLPGSGKSTLAKILSTVNPAGRFTLNVKHVEADQYFMKKGVYKFDPSKLPDAHQWCQAVCEGYMAADYDVVVSNTFTRIKEMEPYIELAKKYGYRLNVIECKGNFGNVHNVPRETLSKMQARWEEWKPSF